MKSIRFNIFVKQSILFKMKSLLFFLMIFFPSIMFCQLLDDSNYEKEVNEIVFNYKGFNVKKFKIKYESKFNNNDLNLDTYYYNFINDSTLIHNFQKYDATYVIRGDKFVYQETESDTKRIKKYFSENYTKSKDSANISFKEYYKIIDEDTILACSLSAADAEKIILIHYPI